MALKQIEKDKLIVALQMDECLNAINTTMRVRGITLRLDYAGADHLARLWVSRPGVEEQGWMVTNPRKKNTFWIYPAHPDLRAFVEDVMERLRKLDATMVIAAEKPYNKKPIAKLQIQFAGAKRIVLTLVDVEKGKSKKDVGFLTPDGRAP